MKSDIKLYDVVALLQAIPDKKLQKGQVGTVVEKLSNEVYEVEFSNNQGETIKTTSIQAQNLLVLNFDLIAV